MEYGDLARDGLEVEIVDLSWQELSDDWVATSVHDGGTDLYTYIATVQISEQRTANSACGHTFDRSPHGRGNKRSSARLVTHFVPIVYSHFGPRHEL